MREVGVHLAEAREAEVQGDPEAIEVGRAEAQLARTPEQPDAVRVLLAERVHEVAGAIGRAVVDDEDGEVAGQAEDLAHDRLDVRRLVVRRDDDDGAAGSRGGEEDVGHGGKLQGECGGAMPAFR